LKLIGIEPSARDACSAQQIQKAERRLGVALPKALREYYALCGKHKINRTHNRLLGLEDLFVAQGRLVFMEENQNVVYWGVPCRSASPDPPVFQAMDPEEGPWARETRCVSTFLAVLLCWQAVGDPFGNGGYSDAIKPSLVRKVARRWTFVGRINDLSAYAADGHAICVLADGKSVTVQVSAKTDQGLLDFGERYGIDVSVM
jgi:hypothetical protein